MPGQRPEVVALVVVDRRLVAEPCVDRVRVGVDLDVVGVVVDVGSRRRGVRGRGHRRSPWSAREQQVLPPSMAIVRAGDERRPVGRSGGVALLAADAGREHHRALADDDLCCGSSHA